MLTTYPLRPSQAITTKPCLKRTKKPTILMVHILLIQRQFENPDDHLYYAETHDEKYIGPFFLRRVEFTLHGLSIELDRSNDKSSQRYLHNGTVGFRGGIARSEDDRR